MQKGKRSVFRRRSRDRENDFPQLRGGGKSGLDRVRVRFAEQINDDLWQFEDALSGVTLLWSRSAGQGRFEWGASPTTVHDGKTGGYSTPPTPVPDSRGIWGLPNPAPEPLPSVPGTPIPEE